MKLKNEDRIREKNFLFFLEKEKEQKQKKLACLGEAKKKTPPKKLELSNASHWKKKKKRKMSSFPIVEKKLESFLVVQAYLGLQEKASYSQAADDLHCCFGNCFEL